ncbi:hypothetical protein [Prevotella ihumii]|uniref:hypothetical protein n=1 Tax=Prevotella ihumii TaxID=1917878 RepID=UPI00192A3C3A|nr:hypothetical protein [Prevotella ihumii]
MSDWSDWSDWSDLSDLSDLSDTSDLPAQFYKILLILPLFSRIVQCRLLVVLKPKSVIRNSLCRTIQRNPNDDVSLLAFR